VKVASDAHYQEWVERRNEYTRRQFEDRIVIDQGDVVREMSAMGECLYYLDSSVYPERALSDWRSFVMDMPTSTGKHTHQGGLVIYVLEGAGWSVLDGVKEEWVAGDLLLLPIKAGGVEHQFFNAQPGSPCRWLSAINVPMFNNLGSEFTQQDYAAEYGLGSGQPNGWIPPYLRGTPSLDPSGAATSPTPGLNHLPVEVFANSDERRQALDGRDLFAELVSIRDSQRKGWRGRGLTRVAGEHLPWERSEFGRVKWFMHPLIFDTCIRTHVVFEQRLDPGESSALVRHQGNAFVYVLAGRGRTRLDGVDWEWKAGDMIQLPARPPGLEFMHQVDASETSPARLVHFELNANDQVGMDRGCGFEVLEPARYRD
jgi:quercetin dioxygenase-like cupin family protein